MRGRALDADPAATSWCSSAPCASRSAVRGSPICGPSGPGGRHRDPLHRRMAVHGKSTSRVDLLARWTEPSDLADGNPPDLAVPHKALADELLLNELPPPGNALVLRTG